MKVYFNKISNFGASKDNTQGYTGWEMARKQFYEQFPDGIVDYPESAYGTKFNALADAITADPVLKQAIDYNPVILQNPSEAIKKLLAQFRNDFLPKEAVTCGHHFNLNDLLKAFEVYHAYWDQWNWNQRSLFWCKVIGYVERLVAAVDAQAFCQGLYYFLEQKQPLVRSFKVVHRNNWNDCDPISYFPALAEMGSKFGIYIGPEAAGPGRPWPQRWPLALLEKLCEAKTSGLDSFKQQLKQPTYRTDQQRASRWWWW